MLRKVLQFARLCFCLVLLLAFPLTRSLPAQGAAIQPQALVLGNGSLVRDPSTGRISLIWDGRRHWITSPLALSELDYTAAQATTVSTATLAAIPESNSIGINVVANNIPWPLSPLQANPVQLSLTTPAVAPGQALPLLGGGYAPNEVLTVYGPDNLTFNFVASSTGSFNTAIPVPTTLPLGQHLLFVQGDQSGLLGVEVFFVTAAAPIPTLSVLSNPVAAGNDLVVSGSGFTPGEQVQIFLASGVNDRLTGANASGAFGPVSFLVPLSVSAGAYSVRAYGAYSHRLTSAEVTVTGAPNAVPPAATMTPTPLPIATATPIIPAHITVSPATTNPGMQVLVSGGGFAPSEVVLLRFNGTLLASSVTDASGSFAGALLTVPSTLGAGIYSVSATGAASGRSASSGITVTVPQAALPASLLASPSSATAGAHVVIAGAGFQPGETVVLYFNGQAIQDLNANATGSFVDTGFYIPQGLATGRYPLLASGALSGRTARATLAVSAPPPVVVPQIFLSARAISPGAALTVSGRGFHPREILLVHLDGTLLLALNADYAGDFKTTIRPSGAYGTHILNVTGATSGLVLATSFLFVRPVHPGIGLLPNYAYPGGLVRVNGNSFAAGEVVLIYFRGQLVQAVTADRNGRFFGASLRVPANTPPGYAAIKLLGAVTGRTTSALLRVYQVPVARASVSASPATLHRGSTTHVSGKNFAAREIVLVRFRGQLLQAFTTNSHGSFSKISVKIPANAPYGSASITLTGTRSRRTASATVHITPVHVTSITVKPLSVHHQATMTVTGKGFAAGEIVLIYLHGTIVAASTADGHGNVSFRFKVPSTIPAGHTTLQAVGARSGYRAQVRVLIY